MNRRNFIGNLLAIGAGFTILPPPAMGRIWKASKPEPFWKCGENPLPFAVSELFGRWKFITPENNPEGLRLYRAEYENFVFPG